MALKNSLDIVNFNHSHLLSDSDSDQYFICMRFLLSPLFRKKQFHILTVKVFCKKNM